MSSPKPIKRLFVILTVLTLWAEGGRIAAQNTSAGSMGSDFWVMFLPNTGGTHQLPDDSCTLIAVGPDDAIITVDCQGVTDFFQLTGGSMTEYLCGTNAEVHGKAYHVTATTDIALYAHNGIFVSHEVAMIVPTRCLGTEYVVQSATDGPAATEMLGFVATEDSTVITIDFHNWLGNRQVPSDIDVPDDGLLHIALQRGETYILGTWQSLGNAIYTWGYFSGKTVSSNGRPFALFQGNSAAHVPITDNYCGTHLYEQAIPLSQWGHTYLLGGVGEQERYYVHVTSGDDSNRMHYNGTYTHTMSRGEIISNQQTPLSSNVASQPYYFSGHTGVSLLLSSYGASGFCGGPASVTVPSVEHGVSEAWFVAPRIVDYQDNYLTIFCDTACAGGLRLDGQLISLSSSFPPNWDPSIQPYHTSVGLGPHHLEIDSGTFVAIVYGLRNGTADSYANAVGMSLDPYPRDTMVRADTICAFSSYSWGPFNYTDDALTDSGTFQLERKMFGPDTVHLYRLTLTVLPAYRSVERHELVPGGSIGVEDTLLTSPGTYVFRHTAANGCDSVLTVVVEPCTSPTPCIAVSQPFIDFDHPVVTLTDCTKGEHTAVWRFSDSTTFTGTKVRRQLRHPLPDSLTATLYTCDRWGCCADSSVTLPLLVRSIWFPNTFTPNGEANNRFGCTTTLELTDFELTIYNRRGQVVYTSTDVTAAWDGTCSGRPMPQGAYVFRWYVKDTTGQHQSGTGIVTLLR